MSLQNAAFLKAKMPQWLKITHKSLILQYLRVCFWKNYSYLNFRTKNQHSNKLILIKEVEKWLDGVSVTCFRFRRFSTIFLLWNALKFRFLWGNFYQNFHVKLALMHEHSKWDIFGHFQTQWNGFFHAYLLVVGFRKSQKSCSWINRDLCVPCREICLEKLFFPWCISRRFWKKKSFDSCFYCHCQSFVRLSPSFGNGYWKNGFKSIEASLAVYPFGPSIVIVCLLQLYLAFFRACRQGLEAAGTQGSGYIT